jgi:hypothetical protein
MKSEIKILMFGLLVTLAFIMVRSSAVAFVFHVDYWGTGAGWCFPLPDPWPPIPNWPQSPQVPIWEDPSRVRDILVDNFEYLDSPYNHGWRQAEPACTINGLIFNTVLDLKQGSRVLDVYRPVFLIGTPCEKHAILYSLFTPPSAQDPEGSAGIDMATNGIVSFDFMTPPGIGPCDIFAMDVIGENGDNVISVRLIPLQPPVGPCLGPFNSAEGTNNITSIVTGYNPSGQLEVTVSLAHGLFDGSWHAVLVDLFDAVKSAVDVFEDIDSDGKADWYIERANTVVVSGRMCRLDNLMFRADYDKLLIPCPDMFEMGPLYAQIFEPYRYLFMADYGRAGITAHNLYRHVSEIHQVTDLMLNSGNFLLVQDPNDPNDPVVKYWTDLGAAPNLFGENDPNIAKLFGRDKFKVDLTLPIFADPNMRMTRSGPGFLAQRIIDQGTLGWNSTIGGFFANHIPAFMLQPLMVYPYDGMPTYIPARDSAIDVIKTYGKPYYSPGIVFKLEGALWNAGITVWPNIAALDFTPQYFEDLIVTIEVTNGVHSDIRTFPISVVNYPVENYLPVVQLNIEDQVFYVGETGEYIVDFIDPDCFIFSISPVPATNHVPGFPISANFRTDMDSIFWDLTLNGAPIHHYAQWMDISIDSSSGLFSFTSQYEGTYDAIVTAKDNWDAEGFGEFEISCVLMYSDTDKDGIYNCVDNCPYFSNPNQEDMDGDGVGGWGWRR